MVVKLYVSKDSGNLAMKCQQDHIRRTLEAKNIEFEEIDIADPHHIAEKEMMKEKMQLSDKDLVSLPPQVFSEDSWKGDYETFFKAIENEKLFNCLDLPCPPDEVEFIREQEEKLASNIIATHKPS